METGTLDSITLLRERLMEIAWWLSFVIVCMCMESGTRTKGEGNGGNLGSKDRR